MEARIAALEKRMDDMEASHRRLSDAVTENNRQTREMYEMFMALENGLRFAGRVFDAGVATVQFLGKIAKPLFWVGALTVAVYTFARTGKWPEIGL